MTGLLILMLIMEGLNEVSSRWTVTESYSVILQLGVSSMCYCL